MRLTMKEKQKATVVVAARYQKARKRDKGKILEEFIELTSYTQDTGDTSHFLLHRRPLGSGVTIIYRGQSRFYAAASLRP